MTCAEFRELAALYAAGGLSAEERAAAEAHLEEPKHDGCFEALRAASAGVEMLARSLVPAQPDDRVWRGIETRLGATAPRRLAWGVAAAVLLLLTGGLIVQSRRMREADDAKAQCLAQLASMKTESDAQRAALALLQSPSALVVSLSPQPGKPPYSARALVDLRQQKGMLLSGTLSPQPGKDYELWVIRGKEPPTPAGLLRAGPSGTVLASIDPLLFTVPPDALAVSVEPQGGSPTGRPTGDIVLVGTLPKT